MSVDETLKAEYPQERSALMMAIDILDEKKAELVAKDIGAWLILFNAKQYLIGEQG